jgi:hypothetical protein
MFSRSGDKLRAYEAYRQAATEEVLAFDALEIGKVRTRGITAVSAVALFYKGQDFSTAEQLAYRLLGTPLPPYAADELRNLLQIIWTTNSAEKAGIKFVSGDVLVSIKGGQVIHGGAPLDLVMHRVEGIQAVLFRTVEMLLEKPFRKRGGPDSDIQSMFKPWLFQAPAGSYQFAVRMQEPEQMQLWVDNRPKLEQVTNAFFKVLKALATDPETELSTLVPNKEYQGAFLNLARSLAPSEKTFERIEVRDASAPAEPLVTLALGSRKGLNDAIRKLRPASPLPEVPEIKISGILRAVHLDQDWLEVSVAGEPPEHLHIIEAGEALDDVVGPMVNRAVIVSVLKRGTKYLYRDIEIAES